MAEAPRRGTCVCSSHSPPDEEKWEDGMPHGVEDKEDDPHLPELGDPLDGHPSRKVPPRRPGATAAPRDDGPVDIVASPVMV